jgi:hypothetical protein
VAVVVDEQTLPLAGQAGQAVVVGFSMLVVLELQAKVMLVVLQQVVIPIKVAVVAVLIQQEELQPQGQVKAHQ